MSYTLSQLEDHLVGMGHGSTLNKVRNKYAVHERAANNFLSKCDPLTSMRTAVISNPIHDDIYNYPLPSDFGKIIDIYPQANRQSTDFAFQTASDTFDMLKLVRDKRISLESSDGTKFLRINWSKTARKTVDEVNASTGWIAINDTANITEDSLYKISGSKALRFDVVTTGDGLQKTTLESLDLSDWDEQATFFMWLYIPDTSTITSITAKWGNDLTTNYWTSAAQTAQADGTAFKIGWNLIKFDWNTATETGTVAPASIDSFSFTIAGSAQSDYRFDSITVSLGSLFELKYYSAYLFKTTAGVYIQRPTTDTDVATLDEYNVNIYLYEWLKAAAQQMEGEDSAFDIKFANAMLNGDGSSPDPFERKGLYRRYKKDFPSQVKKQTSSWMGSRNTIARHWI